MSETPVWIADPRLAWTPTLSCARPAGLDARLLHDRIATLNEQLRPGAATEPVVESDDPDAVLRRTSAARSGGPITAGLGADRLVLSVDHSAGDGLSLLAVLTAITDLPVSSGAAGVGDRPSEHGFVEARVRRLGEVLFSPPAVVPATRVAPASEPGDAFATLRVDGSFGTTALIAATAAACSQDLLSGRASRRVRLAVGLSTVGGAVPRLGDDSALMRLAPATLTSPERIREALRTQGVEPAAGDETYERRPGLARITSRAQALLASRLGSTVLVSHLGRVTAGEPLRDLAFYPVTGGASGLALGAVVQDGRTTLAARARGAQHDREGLSRILDAVADRLR